MKYLEKKLHAKDLAAPLGTSNNPSYAIWTVANVITLSRIVLTILFFVLFCMKMNRIFCVAIYAVAASTDFLDGYLARKTSTVSWFGKLLDPIVDRVLIFAGVIGLCVVGDLPLWILCFLIGRDILLGFGMIFIKRIQHRPLDVLFIGKVTTALLLFGFSWMLLGCPTVEGPALFNVLWLPGLNGITVCPGIFFVYAGIICSFITFILYVAEGMLALHEKEKDGFYV